MWNNHRYPHVYVGDCDHVQPLVGAGTRTRSQTGLRFHKPNATVCVIKWIWQIRKRWSLHKTNNIVNINYIHTYRELSYSQNDLITAARARPQTVWDLPVWVLRATCAVDPARGGVWRMWRVVPRKLCGHLNGWICPPVRNITCVVLFQMQDTEPLQG